ncbi:MAG: transglutaminase domain-containing protein [Lachnospiraceae bacterium]|nr:transglutaminase domain-containing protein [Lachnospiraceae bacterium]
MRSRKIREIDTAFKPIVRARRVSAAGMVAYLAVVFSALFLLQYVFVYTFNRLYELNGEMKAVILPIALISALVILLWSIRVVHFPVILVLVAIYVLWVYSQFMVAEGQLTSLQSLLDEIFRRYADYYGFNWKGFRVTEITKYYTDQAFRNGRLITLTFIFAPMTLWLGYNLIRKFRISSVALVLLFPCLLVLMNGFTPDRYALIRIILLFAVVGVIGVQMRIEEKHQTVKGREADEGNGIFCLHPPKAVFPLYVTMMATAVAAMAFPTLFEEKITEFVKPAQEFMYSGGPERILKSLRGKIFGTSSGGISGGDLGSTGAIQPDKDHVLLSVYKSAGLGNRYSYLKCYVGEVYTGKRWTELPDIILDQYRAGLEGMDLARREYSSMRSIGSVLDTLANDNVGDAKLRSSLKIGSEHVDIMNVDYTDGYKIVPYFADRQDGVNTALSPYSKEDFQSGEYLYYDLIDFNVPFLVRLYDAYLHEKGYMGAYSDTPESLANTFYDALYSSLNYTSSPQAQVRGRMIPEILFQYYGQNGQTGEDAIYENILREYLNVPESVERLREYMKDVRIDGYEDAAVYVRDTLEELAEYSLTPGKISGDVDFVDEFLFEKKAGYCMHFASAGTVMFRLLGIPARYVEGFYLSPSGSSFQDVTEENAHAWVEIYLRNLGWVPIEVTPGFGSMDDWKKTYHPVVKPTTPVPTQVDSTSESTTQSEKTSVAIQTQDVPTKVPNGTNTTIVPGGSWEDLTTRPGEKEDGPLLWPVIWKVLKEILIVLGSLLFLYLLIFLRRSFLLAKRSRDFTQRDPKKSVASLYEDMRRLAAIEHRNFTYETDGAEVVSWFEELAENEELFNEAIEMINLCFFGNRPIENEDRKIILRARNKMAMVVAKRQTGRNKLRYHLWYGY